MANKGAFLGVLGILLGIGGIGFGVVNWIYQPTIPYGPHWYSYNNDQFYPSTLYVYFPIPNISIVFELERPMSLHLLFRSSAFCLGDPGSYSDLFFYFMINGVQQTEMPWTRVGSFESSTTYEYYSVTLQHYIDFLPAGIYNITVAVMTQRLGNYVREPTFWIQSYIA
ncbi:MAG: hypothetical protein ACFFG0_57350 [Candidatus Thorarchaeota archaeon]